MKYLSRAKPYRLNYLQGFWLNLLRDIIKRLSRCVFIKDYLPFLGRFSGFKLRWEHVVIAFLLAALILRGGPTHIVRSQIRGVSPAPAMMRFSTLPELKEPSQALLSPLEPVYVNKLRSSGTYANAYVPGQCTAYVASRLPVPNNWGNAINWGYAAMLAGYTISDIPKAGAIAWSTTDSYLGHVAVVEADGVTISEMNYNGPFSVDSRLPHPGEFRYIYI